MSATTVTPQRGTSGQPGPLRDSRLHQRRVAVARQQGRRRLRLLLSLLAAGALVGGALGVLHSPLLAARHVVVTGAAHTPVAEVLAVSGLDRHPPLIDLDTGAAAAAIDRLPWVASAAVSRHWPDSVSVRLVERRPVAVVAAGGLDALVDAGGRVLATGRSAPAGLVELATGGAVPPAPGGELPAADRPLLAAAAGLAPQLRDEVAAISWRSGDGVQLRLVHGPVVELGAAPQMAEVSVALATLIAKVPLAHVVAIDLRVPDDPVLTP